MKNVLYITAPKYSDIINKIPLFRVYICSKCERSPTYYFSTVSHQSQFVDVVGALHSSKGTCNVSFCFLMSKYSFSSV